MDNICRIDYKKALETGGITMANLLTTNNTVVTYTNERPRMKLNPDLDITIPIISSIASNNGRCPWIFEANSTIDDHCPCPMMLVHGKCVVDLYIEDK